MRISRTVEIAMGHRLKDHPGRCRHIHGHNYQIEVSLAGGVNFATGMVIDFHDLKQAMHEVLDKYDHAMVLEDDDPCIQLMTGATDRLIVINRPPTAENLAQLWYQEFQEHFPQYEVAILVKETKDTTAIAIYGADRIGVDLEHYGDRS